VGLDLPSVLEGHTHCTPHFFNACPQSEIRARSAVLCNRDYHSTEAGWFFTAVCRLICGGSSAGEVSLIDRSQEYWAWTNTMYENLPRSPLTC